MVTSAYLRSCIVLMGDLTLSNIPHDWLITWNESLITRARNEMTATFLKTEWSHMMWLDADIEFTTDDVVKLWNMDADVAVGCYAMKKPEKQYFAAWKDGALVTDLDQFKEPIEVDYAGTGFMLIKRSVIETLAAKAEKYQGPDGEVAAIYMTPVEKGVLLSEDYYFCQRAKEAGFKIMMEPNVRLVHWGQYPFGKNYSGAVPHGA